MEPSVLDDVIGRLLERGMPGKQVQLSESEVRQLCIESRTVFLQQPNLLELEAPFKICGDIHGQYFDLLRLFEYGGYPPQVNYLFMGNYVDYGKQSLETICLLLAYKIKYPETFFLLRGNHEDAMTNRIYGFYDECTRRHNVPMWKLFNKCFNCLPVAALIDDKILCVHGGLSPDLRNLDQIRNLQRPTVVPETGLLCDLLWSDPSRDIRGWEMNDSGFSYTFGPDIVSEFLVKHDLDLICRSNQVVEDGYEFFADRQLVTIFSAPNFRGEYDNAGAMMRTDETLVCSFQILLPAEKKFKFNIGITNSSKFPSGPSFGSAATARPRNTLNVLKFNIGITNSSKFPSGPSFGSAATARPRNTLNVLDSIAEEDTPTRTNAAKSKSSLKGPDVGSRRTVKPENSPPGAKGAFKKAPDTRTDAVKSVSSSSKATMMKPGSTPTGANTGTRSAASTRARPSTPRYSSPGGARALGGYVGQSAKAVTRAVSPFNPERDGRRR